MSAYYIENHHKDKDPMDTVTTIRQIIRNLGYTPLEEWAPPNSAETFSVRVTLKEFLMEVGSNGKGVTRELALASAYGELSERLQNQLFSYCTCFANDEKNFFIDEFYLSWQELLSDKYPLHKEILKNFDLENLASHERITYLNQLFCTDKILMRPFYHYNQNRIDYLPWNLMGMFYGSNGMCAGNSLEEALVQGLSEIIERHVQRIILTQKYIAPDIPDEYIKKYPYVWERYKKLKENPNYYLAFKDYSLGGKYPVAGLVMAQKGTDKFGLKLGVHPNYGVAMERAITEALQGMDEHSFASSATLDLSNHQVEHDINIYNTFKTIYGKYPKEILLSSAPLDFFEHPDVSHCSNKDLLTDMLTKLENDGHDIFIRNVSFLNFPACQIVIPGMSNLLPYTPKNIRARNSLAKTSTLLRNPSQINQADIQQINLTVRFWKSSFMDNTMIRLYDLPLTADIPGDENGHGIYFLEAITFYALGQFEKAQEVYQYWMACEKNSGQEIAPYYLCLYHFIAGKVNNILTEDLCRILSPLFDEKLIEKIKGQLCDTTNILKNFYPILPCPDCAHCNKQSVCSYKEFQTLMEKLWKQQKEYGLTQETLIPLIGKK